MKINTKIRYGLRMLVLLAEEGKLVNTAELGRRMLVSPKYLRKLAGPLEHAGIIRSVQGVYGGYYLSKGANEITVFNIFEIFEEPIQIVECRKGECCALSADCLTRPLWAHLEDVLTIQLKAVTIEKLLNKTVLEPLSSCL